MANTFHQNLMQSFANFKSKYIGNVPSGVTLTQVQYQIVPTASIEIGETASKAYNVGDFLVKDGILYKVTNAIVKGDALTVGTNIVLDTVGGEIKALNGRLTQVEDRLEPCKTGDVYNFPATDGATYIAPTDGYLFVRDGGAITILDTNGRISSESNRENLIFIRKGMILTRKGSSGYCRFISLA